MMTLAEGRDAVLVARHAHAESRAVYDKASADLKKASADSKKVQAIAHALHNALDGTIKAERRFLKARGVCDRSYEAIQNADKAFNLALARLGCAGEDLHTAEKYYKQALQGVPHVGGVIDSVRNTIFDLQYVKYDPERKALDLASGKTQGYYIYLEDCNTKAEILGELLHVSRKSWVTARMLGELVVAFDILLAPDYNLQHAPTFDAEVVAQTKYALLGGI